MQQKANISKSRNTNPRKCFYPPLPWLSDFSSGGRLKLYFDEVDVQMIRLKVKGVKFVTFKMFDDDSSAPEAKQRVSGQLFQRSWKVTNILLDFIWFIFLFHIVLCTHLHG